MAVGGGGGGGVVVASHTRPDKLLKLKSSFLVFYPHANKQKYSRDPFDCFYGILLRKEDL